MRLLKHRAETRGDHRRVITGETMVASVEVPGDGSPTETQAELLASSAAVFDTRARLRLATARLERALERAHAEASWRSTDDATSRYRRTE